MDCHLPLVGVPDGLSQVMQLREEVFWMVKKLSDTLRTLSGG